WLVQLLPELAQVAPPLVPAWGLPPEQERRLLFAAVARFLANASGPAGTLLVLDDLQWAGADALDLLASLVRGHRDRPLQIIGAYRGTEVPTQHHFAMLLADLAREGLATHVELGPLSGGEAAQLIHSLLEGELAAALMEQVLKRADGVPYFLVSSALGLRAGVLPDGSGAGVPWDMEQSIRQRTM